ncbi:citramalate synthase [Streptomyces apocyni]|uniref:citramalate synthase n=1 Tax=Streptomyces apocyni TaxID=2654677 RepID=UPI0012E9AB7E|nr:citramalate synthase [Streptomyces apocyni]
MAEQGLQLYDTTLRDGTQQKGMVLTVDDKLAVARHLDALGVTFIEGGWPGAVPRDTEFFRRARRELDLKHAQLAAFGATRKAATPVLVDAQVRALLEAESPVVTLVAKSDPRHVSRALRTTLAENLAMVSSTVRHLVRAGRRVFVDAEHYFDGYLDNREYALEVVRTAAEAGAEAVVLCDTNGGSLPDGIRDIVADTLAMTGAAVGIHCHDDSGCAVANTMAAVDAGAIQVQGTAHGYGERCGNANLFTVIANLVLKRGREVIPPENLRLMAAAGTAIAELTQLTPPPGAPYVGEGAFTHKAGLHASALRVEPDLYQHIDPGRVGNAMRTLVSDMGGRSSIELKARELGYDIEAGSPEVARTAARIKELESQGYSFESADASFALLLREELTGDGSQLPPFDVDSWRVSVSGAHVGQASAEASVRLRVDGVPLGATCRASTPVHALDTALQKALVPFFADLARLELVDYAVRVLSGGGAGTTTRVRVTYRDGDREWSTVGVGENEGTAAWHALLDAIRYALLPVPEPSRGGGLTLAAVRAWSTRAA